MNDDVITTIKETSDKCLHEWKLISERKYIQDLENRIWILENHECQKCFCLKQGKSRFR